MKNTHLEHPEDSILTGDLSVLDWFLSDGEISAKIDGAPADIQLNFVFHDSGMSLHNNNEPQ